ncbi:hypothetical protein TRFO_20489 [Tritrichomonas foetus]|uniref:Adenylate and Guanylate cyclase catalytic domain containing protein n=1 Tax=Tritrichomonas foetus TaxID=1144522 RepID=A0A1J4KG02_9EUKA|nr:hypothetical protein TRFO_20489 [Tritrichomonas foetus]|eukprot:OHT10345.1 hypothetical protein TRFO_20489 [Tritrichomonas foetus]
MATNEEADNLVAGKLRYASVLDVSYLTIFNDLNLKYIAKINTQPGLPKAVYIIINIIIIIQLIGPSFFVDSPLLWDQDSVFSYFLQSIGVIWQLWSGSTKVVIGLVLVVLELVYEITSAILIIRFSKRQIADRSEGIATLLVGKYVRPILLVLISSALPEAFASASQPVSIIFIVFFIICAVIAPFDIFRVTVRILVENNPNHEWSPSVVVFTLITTCLVSTLGCAVRFVNQIGHAALMVICALLYAAFGLFLFIYSPTIKRSFSLLLCAFSFTGCFVSIINLIIVFIGNVSQAVIIILFIVILVLCYIILHFINKKKTTKLLMIFSQCEGCPDDAEEILTRAFPKCSNFICAVHIVFQHWPPFLLCWKPFSIFMQKYPENNQLCILWCRICSLFPQESELFRWLINQYANLKPNIGRTSYLQQMVTIQSSRFTDTTPVVMKSISNINRYIQNATALQHRFWERILQKRVDMFWNDITSLKKLIEKIEIEINQLLDSYPNNSDVVELYCQFLLNVKADYTSYQEWTAKLHQLQLGNRLQQDFALQAARLFLPELQQFCVESSSAKKPDEISPKFVSDKISDSNVQQQQVHVGLQQFIRKARVGSICVGTVTLIIGTAAAIGVFILYLSKFTNQLVSQSLHRCNFMVEVKVGLMNLEFLALYVGLYPLALSGDWTPCNYGTSKQCNDMMDIISPNIYSSGRVPNWTLQSSYVGAIVANARARLLKISYALANLTSSPGANEIYTDLYITPYLSDMPLIQALTKYMLDSTNLMKIETAKEFLTDPIFLDFDKGIIEIVQQLITYPHKMFEVSTAEMSSILTDLSQNFVLVVFVSFLLISLPLILSHFMLVMESNSVSSAFISLPNTAVREILQNRDKKGNQKGNGSQSLAVSSDSSTALSTLQIYAIFILSSGCILACSLYLYYQSSSFSTTIAEDLERIAHIHDAAIYSLDAGYRFVRLATTDAISQKPEFESLDLGFTRSEQISNAMNSLLSLRDSISDGLWGTHRTVSTYYQTTVNIDYFEDVVPGVTSQDIPPPLSLFEQLAIIDILEEFEYAASKMQLQLQEVENTTIDTHSEIFLNLGYYFSSFVGTHRYPQFFDPVINQIKKDFTSLDSLSDIILIIVIIVQIFALIIMIIYLFGKSQIIRYSLNMLLFFNPTFVLQNQNVISLVTNGTLKAYSDENSYKDAERVVECTNESIVLLDKKMIIHDINDAFIQCVGLKKEDIIGKMITDMFKSTNRAESIETILLRVHEALRGNGNPNFKDKMSVSTPNGANKIVIVNVLCLTPLGTASESDFNDINAVVFIIEDQTDHQLIEQKINAEKQKITTMLNRVMPNNVVEELQKGAESISVAVQSASVGCIKVTSSAQFDKEDFNAPFQFFSKVYNVLDEMMKEFPALTKIRTFSHTYEYAGGLFGSVNKPNKHAEIATRFALKVISSANKIAEAIGHEVSFTIGLNTGGPLVAGVISVSKPNFHLIGPTVELAQRMKSTGIKNQIHVTRAVYELVYAYNFHVTERGDIDIGGGRTLRTYVIVP